METGDFDKELHVRVFLAKVQIALAEAYRNSGKTIEEISGEMSVDVAEIKSFLLDPSTTTLRRMGEFLYVCGATKAEIRFLKQTTCA